MRGRKKDRKKGETTRNDNLMSHPNVRFSRELLRSAPMNTRGSSYMYMYSFFRAEIDFL